MPEPEFDLSWLDRLGEEEAEPAAPDLPEEQPVPGSEAPTVLIPPLPREDGSRRLADEPTAVLPPVYRGTPQQRPEPPRRPEPPQRPERPPQPQRTEKEAGKPGKAKMGTGLLLGIIAGCMVLALVIGVFIYGLTLKGGKTIYPNVYVAGINVGGMEREEAIAAVDGAVKASYASATLKVQLPDRTLSFSPEQTNVALDADEAIGEALAYGRSGNPFSAVTSYFSCRSREHYIDLQTILDLDTDYIHAMIDQVAAEVESDPAPTKVRYDQAAQALIVDVGYPDRDLDADGLYEVVYNAFMNSDFTPLSWDYDEVPCEPVDLEAYYEKHCTEAQDAVYDELTHTIQASEVGFGFDLEEVQKTLATAAAGSQVVIRLEEQEPEVDEKALEKEMFGTTLFTASSEYVNNPGRTENLRLACEAIDGTILNPGEVFSFNGIVGERTADKGYQAATVYNGGQSVQELGGGVCQVASTIYYATLHLDLEQVHREPHQYAVTYVPYGMDATVYWGSIDYQFKNTLSHPLKIEANIDNGHVNITLLGVRENDNTVEMSYTILESYPWQEVEELDETKPVGYREVEVTPYTGYKVVTYKTIKDADGNEISRNQEAVSVYSKRDQKVIVGPAEEPFEPNPWPDDEEDPWDPWPEDPDPDDPDPENPWP